MESIEFEVIGWLVGWGTSMKSLEEYRRWFQEKARELPDAVRREVEGTLNTSDYRSICFGLTRLSDAGKLPEEWSPVLTDFCFSTY
jgi:hypothetical protein